MNIIEAIKSGKKYRLHGTEGWFHPTVEHLQNSVFFSVQHILADDWEVESAPVTITREQFDCAVKAAVAYKDIYGTEDIFDLLAKELGL